MQALFMIATICFAMLIVLFGLAQDMKMHLARAPSNPFYKRIITEGGGEERYRQKIRTTNKIIVGLIFLCLFCCAILMRLSSASPQ